VFTQVFGIFGRFAPVAVRAHALELRAPPSGLIGVPASPSMAALVIALLATVTFDGLLETPLWARIDVAILEAPADSFLWTVLDLREDQALRLVRTLALPLFVALFAAAFFLVCRWMAALAHEPFATTDFLLRRFVFTLVPISLAYHVAHYFSSSRSNATRRSQTLHARVLHAIARSCVDLWSIGLVSDLIFALPRGLEPLFSP